MRVSDLSHSKDTKDDGSVGRREESEHPLKNLLFFWVMNTKKKKVKAAQHLFMILIQIHSLTFSYVLIESRRSQTPMAFAGGARDGQEEARRAV